MEGLVTAFGFGDRQNVHPKFLGKKPPRIRCQPGGWNYSLGVTEGTGH
jgi:hypothetical protein